MSDIEPSGPAMQKPSRRERSEASTRAPIPMWAWLLFGSGVVAALLLVCVLVLLQVFGGRPAASPPGTLPTITLLTVPASTATVTMTPPPPEPAASRTTAPTPTSTLPPPPPGSLAIGNKVQVVNTGGDGLSLRSEPGTYAPRMAVAMDGELLEVVDGPRVISGYTWWQLKRSDGVQGWGVQNFLQLVP